MYPGYLLEIGQAGFVDAQSCDPDKPCPREVIYGHMPTVTVT